MEVNSEPSKVRTPGLSEPNVAEMPRISAYLNYRLYLKDFYAFKRKTQSTITRTYSYAMFSAAADIKSPNYLKLVMEGERNLSVQMSEKFARAIGLSKSECEEFKVLVLFNQALDPLERSKYLKQLENLRLKKKVLAGEIAQKTLDSVPGWLSWVILQMLDQKNVDFTVEKITKLIRGNVSIDMVKSALENLQKAGMIEKDDLGQFRRSVVVDGGADEVPVDLIRKIQSEFALLALESLFQDSAKDKEFGTLTVCLTQEEFDRFKFELRQFRKRWHKDFSAARTTTKGDRVYQMNLQLFPVTEQILDN